jgi:signal transduction histidine kinase
VRRPALTPRLRLTLLSTGIVALGAGLLLALSWSLLARHLGRTLPEPYVSAVTGRLAGQYALALFGALLVAAGAGWLIAGRALAPLQRFVANASHELRTPLTVIRTEAEVTLDDPDATVEDLRAATRLTLAELDRTEQLLESLLLLAASGRGARRGGLVDLAAVARRAVDGLRAEAVAASVELELSLAPVRVRGDTALLERVVANLVANAVRHSPGNRAAVRVRAETDRAVIEVANGGAVIAPELVARLAEPFQRLDRSGATRGAGLGLSIVRAVAEAHGGWLTLEAPRSGGLRARVVLPVTSG